MGRTDQHWPLALSQPPWEAEFLGDPKIPAPWCTHPIRSPSPECSLYDMRIWWHSKEGNFADRIKVPIQASLFKEVLEVQKRFSCWPGRSRPPRVLQMQETEFGQQGTQRNHAQTPDQGKPWKIHGAVLSQWVCGNLLCSNRKLLHPLIGYVSVHSLAHTLLVHISEDVFVEEKSILRKNAGAGVSVSLAGGLKLKTVALPLTCPRHSTPVSWTWRFAHLPLFTPSGKSGQDGSYDFTPGLPDHRSRFG